MTPLFLVIGFAGWVFAVTFMNTFCVWQLYRLVIERTKEYWFFLVVLLGSIAAWAILIRFFNELGKTGAV